MGDSEESCEDADELLAVRCELTVLRRQRSPAAETEIDFAGLTAQREAAPFQNVTDPEVFSKR